MSRFERLARRLALVLGLLAGCGGAGMGGLPPADPSGTPPPAQPARPTSAELAADVRANVERLRGLEVVDVYSAVFDTPEASNCYGAPPCPGSESNPDVAAELARQAPRLARLTDIAAGLAAATEGAPADPAGAAADLAALDGLRIVELGNLLTVAPAANPICYNTPCPSDVAAATAENGRRAGIVHAWAAEAVSEKL
jgi:hypothetical protein